MKFPLFYIISLKLKVQSFKIKVCNFFRNLFSVCFSGSFAKSGFECSNKSLNEYFHEHGPTIPLRSTSPTTRKNFISHNANFCFWEHVHVPKFGYIGLQIRRPIVYPLCIHCCKNRCFYFHGIVMIVLVQN